MPKSSSSPLTGRLAERLAELATLARVPGAVLGIWADEQQTMLAHGVLSTATGIPVTTDSVFQVGSITKVWTATMIMQLVERLSLDTTVSAVRPRAAHQGGHGAHYGWSLLTH